MTKKVINQNDKFREELINTIEPNFVFNDKPINRFTNNGVEHDGNLSKNKTELLVNLKKQINSIENCKLKENSKKIILGEGNINSPLMLIGETPGAEEEKLASHLEVKLANFLTKCL